MINDAFLQAMSRAANTVCVVTTDGPAGKFGVTVSAMTSVSIDDAGPSLLVCVHQLSPACDAIRQNGVFNINLLGADQASVSDCFAGRTGAKGVDKFACADWSIGETGVPVLVGAQASFECHLIEDTPVGSHCIFVGRVVQASSATTGAPLVYHDRTYARLAPL